MARGSFSDGVPESQIFEVITRAETHEEGHGGDDIFVSKSANRSFGYPFLLRLKIPVILPCFELQLSL
jgi:hypothetical protein